MASSLPPLLPHVVTWEPRRPYHPVRLATEGVKGHTPARRLLAQGMATSCEPELPSWGQRKRLSVQGVGTRSPRGVEREPPWTGRGCGQQFPNPRKPPHPAPWTGDPGGWVARGARSCSPAAPRRPGLNVQPTARSWLSASMPPAGDGSGKAGYGALSDLPPRLAWAWDSPCRRLLSGSAGHRGVSTPPPAPQASMPGGPHVRLALGPPCTVLGVPTAGC